MRSRAKLVFALLAALAFTTVPAHATCSRESCLLGGSLCVDQLLYDTHFSQGCAWVYGTTNTSRVQIGSNWYAQLSGFGSVYQTIDVPSGYEGNTMDLGFEVQVAPSNPGSESLYVEILSSTGTLLETVTRLTPSSASTRYDFEINNYSGQTIKVRFRYATGTQPGGTVFRVDWCDLWLMNY